MERARSAQLNIRSDFAKARAAELVRETGMTTVQVVEEALKAFHPGRMASRPTLVRKGRLLVAVVEGRPPLTVEDVQRSIDEEREGRMDDVW